MKQLVLSIKDTNVLHEAEDTLPYNSREGRRNHTILQISKATLLWVSDMSALRRNEIYKTDGDIRKNACTHDKETGKPNILYFKPIKWGLIDYLNWLNEQDIQSERLFPSSQDHSRYIIEKQFYKIMARTGDLLGINYLGTRGMRETGACRVYTQIHYNVGLVMSFLNHTSEAMTLKCLGLDQVSREKMFDEVKFD